MKSYKDRLYKEITALEKKLRKLKDFLNTDNYKSLLLLDRELLTAQYHTMESYRTIIVTRLNRA